MDVPPVYMRNRRSCTPVVEDELSTAVRLDRIFVSVRWDGVRVALTRWLPPPLVTIVVLALALTVAPRADAGGTWAWPLVGPVVREFDKPDNDYSEGHRGIDIGALRGREVRSPTDGVVWFAGRVAGKSVVSIDTADGSIVAMEPVEASVQRGDVVRRGDTIGIVSDTHDGMSAIHLGIRVDGVYVNPRQYLGNPPRIVVYDSWLDSYALG